MQRILILGGGVGGHPHRQPARQEAPRPDRPRRGRGHGRRRDRPARLPAGFMYIAMGGERAEQPAAPGALAARQARDARRRRGRRRSTRPTPDRHARPTACRSATTTSCWRPARASSPRRSSTSTPRPSTSTPPRRPLELRTALDAFTGGRIVIGDRRHALQVPAGAARGRVPHRGRAARARPARPSEIDFCSPIGRAFTIESVSEMATPILEDEGHRAPHVLQRRGDRPERKVVQSLEGEELPVRPADPRAAAQGPAVPHRLRPRAGARRLAADRPARPSRSAAGRTSSPSATRPTCRSRRPARRPTSRPVVTERIVAAIEGREVDHKHGDYLGKVMCFFEIGDGKGTLLQFDYEHPPRPPKPNQLWHLGKIVFNKTYWHTVPKGRV